MASKDHFHSVVATLQPVVHGVAEDRMRQASPCDDWTVGDVANHLLGTSEAMRKVAAGEEQDRQDPWGTNSDNMSTGWREDLATRLTNLADAWTPEDAWEGEANGAPKQGMGDMAFVEVMLHGWDLARGSGQDVAFDEDAVQQAREVMAQIGPMGREQGAFGDRVEIDEDASDWEWVLSESGRDPGWTAG